MDSQQSVTRSYEYNFYCRVCYEKVKFSTTKLRWDGLRVCPQCWEIRHPLDFYRTRNDTHKLPEISSSDGAPSGSEGLSWSPTPSAGLTNSTVTGETYTVNSGSYYADSLQGKTRAIFTITFTDGSGLVFSNPKSTTSSSSTTVTLPTTPGGSGTVNVSTSLGEFLGTGTVTSGNTTATLPDWSGKRGNIIISALYTT